MSIFVHTKYLLFTCVLSLYKYDKMFYHLCSILTKEFVEKMLSIFSYTKKNYICQFSHQFLLSLNSLPQIIPSKSIFFVTKCFSSLQRILNAIHITMLDAIFSLIPHFLVLVFNLSINIYSGIIKKYYEIHTEIFLLKKKDTYYLKYL